MKSLFSKPELVINVCKAHSLPYLAQLSLDLEYIEANQARKPVNPSGSLAKANLWLRESVSCYITQYPA